MNKFDPEVMKQLLYQLDSTSIPMVLLSISTFNIVDRILAASNYACDFINMAPEIAKVWTTCLS